MSVSVRVCVCMQGVGAREVSSSVALHLTSILITPFQQRSSSQPLPQSNGLTQEASLHSRASPDLLLLLLHTHRCAHTHTHTEMQSLISLLSGRIRWKQISSAPVTSSGTGLLLHRRYHLISSTSTYTPPQIVLKKKHIFSLSRSLPLSLFPIFCFFQYGRINLKGVNWKIK